MKKFILNNKLEIPCIGYGTWKLPNSNETSKIIKEAIKTGYRHIDTAAAYGNEKFIGKGIKKSEIEREQLFITGKLWNDSRDYNKVIEACKQTIKNLDCKYLDLYLIHWPASPALYNDWVDINNLTWRAMEYLYNSGLVKSIGVSNFKCNQLEKLIEKANIIPAVNQIEFHPGQVQKEIREYCFKKNIIVEAWSPLGSGKMLKSEALKNIAVKYNISVSQLCIKWCLQNNVLPIPKSLTEEHMKMNLETDKFVLSKDDMEFINGMEYFGGSGLDSETITIFN